MVRMILHTIFTMFVNGPQIRAIPAVGYTGLESPTGTATPTNEPPSWEQPIILWLPINLAPYLRACAVQHCAPLSDNFSLRTRSIRRCEKLVATAWGGGNYSVTRVTTCLDYAIRLSDALYLYRTLLVGLLGFPLFGSVLFCYLLLRFRLSTFHMLDFLNSVLAVVPKMLMY